MRPIPAPEKITDARKLVGHVRFAKTEAAARTVMALSHKSVAIVERVYGSGSYDRAPHGYYQTGAFVDACRERHALSKLRACVFWELVRHAVERGRLELAA